tara:strand:+ start:45368 stop:45568 length:201 start_codon:yes stop_codon:yes gene_type:complete
MLRERKQCLGKAGASCQWRLSWGENGCVDGHDNGGSLVALPRQQYDEIVILSELSDTDAPLQKIGR